MYAPHTVTLYTVKTVTDPTTLKETTETNITLLDGAFLDAVKAENVRSTGRNDADAAMLYIPFDIKAIDGITGSAKSYIGPNEYWIAKDTTGLWTMSTGGNSFFVKGVVVRPELTLQQIYMAYDDVYVINTVDAKDYGSPSMRHWEVGGK